MRKKLIIKQVDEYDCGVCCLLSIIRFYNGNVPLELLKIDSNTSRFGTNALELINAAKKYGFEGKGLKTKELNDLKCPAIAHLKLDDDFYHFVVIYEKNKDYYIVMDPAIGKQKIEKNKFLNLFTGNLIILTPITEITYLKSNPTLINLIKLFIKSNKKDIIKLYLIEFILILITIINSFILKLISTNIFVFTIIFLISLFIQNFLVLIKNRILPTINNILNLNLTKNFFSHLLLLPLKFIQLKSNGEILTRFKELRVISNFIINVLFKNLIELIICLFVFVIIILFQSKISFIIFISSLFIILISYYFYKYTNPKIIKEINNESDYNTKLNEYINSLETIKVINNYSYFHKVFNLNLKDKVTHSIKLEKILLNEDLLKEFIFSFVSLSLIFYSLYLHVSLINIITLLNLSAIFFNTLKSLLNDLKNYNYIKNIFIKLNEFFNIEEEKVLKTNNNFASNITFQNVVFSYNSLKQLSYNFSIKENAFFMIKGKNGSGKSTICKFLTKILTNYKGNILIGNKNIKDYSEIEIRNIISYSNQSAKLFKDTIKNNIILNKNISDKIFNEIAEICDLENVVKDKPNRYNSLIYENSPNFSGGEVQKIILARTLLQDRKIIILDETLSAVNINTEIKIINMMKKHLKNKTIIYITHKNLEKYFDDCIELERN